MSGKILINRMHMSPEAADTLLDDDAVSVENIEGSVTPKEMLGVILSNGIKCPITLGPLGITCNDTKVTKVTLSLFTDSKAMARSLKKEISTRGTTPAAQAGARNQEDGTLIPALCL
jgi:hypothetical protein